MQHSSTSQEQGSAGSDLVNKVKEGASSTAEGMKERLADAGRKASDQASSVAERGKEQATQKASSVAQALHRTSETLRDEQQELASKLTDGLASRIDQVTEFLQNRDVAALGREVEGLARRQPALFMGGAFTVGLLMGRFLKSSSQRDREAMVFEGEQELNWSAGEPAYAPQTAAGMPTTRIMTTRSSTWIDRSAGERGSLRGALLKKGVTSKIVHSAWRTTLPNAPTKSARKSPERHATRA